MLGGSFYKKCKQNVKIGSNLANKELILKQTIYKKLITYHSQRRVKMKLKLVIKDILKNKEVKIKLANLVPVKIPNLKLGGINNKTKIKWGFKEKILSTLNYMLSLIL